MAVVSFPNGNYQLDHDSALSSQDQGGNSSSVYFRTIVRKIAGSGYAGSDGWWVATDSSLGPANDLGYSSGSSWSFKNGSNSGEWWYHQGNFTVPHDANGYASYWTNAQARFGSSVGTSPFAETGWRNLPRIPKKPSQPGTPQFTNVLPTSLTVSWAGSSDNAGSGIDGYLLRRWDGQSAAGAYVDNFANNTSRTVTGLTPGNWYTFGVYAHNGSADNGGYSTVSALATIRMIAGGRIRVAGVYKTALPYQRVSGVYKLTLPFVKRSGAWKNTL